MNSNWSETPLANFLRLMADLLGLNLLFLAFCIPVVTIGPALSAMYAVLIRRERNDGAVAVLRTFFHAMKQNFWKALLLELVVAALLIVTGGDLWYAFNLEGMMRSLYVVVGTIMAIVTMIVCIMAFSQQSVYQNSIPGYLKNSFALTICAPLELIVSILGWAVPWVLMFAFFDEMIQLGALYLMWGFSFPAWITAKMMERVFQKTNQEA